MRYDVVHLNNLNDQVPNHIIIIILPVRSNHHHIGTYYMTYNAIKVRCVQIKQICYMI